MSPRRRKRAGEGEEDGVYHLPDIAHTGPKLDIGEPPEDLSYADHDDWASEQLLERNGVELTEEGVVAALQTKHGTLLAAAAHVAGSRSLAGAAPVLRDVAEEGGELASVEAAYALARLGEADGVEMLRDATRMPVGASLGPVLAAGFLARLGDPSGLPVVRSGLDSEFIGTRMLACKQLFAFWPFEGREDVLDLFRRALDDREPSVQGEALVQIAEIRASAFRPLLEAFLGRSRDAFLKRLATEALANLT